MFFKRNKPIINKGKNISIGAMDVFAVSCVASPVDRSL
jgi:hypothetical protein